MNSRERVLAAMNFENPDRPPVDFGGHRSSGIMAIAYHQLKKHLGIKTGDIYVYDMVQQLAIVEEPVLDALGIDVIEMGRGFLKDEKDWKDWELPDGTPCKIPFYVNVKKQGEHWKLYNDQGTELGIQKKGSLYFEQTNFPSLEKGIEKDDFSDLTERFNDITWTAVPHPGAHFPLDQNGLNELKTKAKALRESTDKAIIGLFGGNMFELPQWLYRMDNYLLYMGKYPDKIIELSKKLCEIHLQNLEKWLSAVGPYIDIILFGDDFGGQNRLLISPTMYRRYYKPYHKKLWTRAKELADVKTQLHCCGSIELLLEDFIEAGIDAVNPVQISCLGMEPEFLKEKYNKRLCFWGGGCDTRSILPKGSLDEITQHVKNQVDIFNKDGGFVFQQVHNIMANVPPENIVAMFKAIHQTD
jgi:uroporphyrinogen decarboxylase